MAWRAPAILALALALLALAPQALAQNAGSRDIAPGSEKRVALVVGNSAYKNIPALGNPKNDAMLIARTLVALGFTLVGGGAQIDLDREKFTEAIRSFGRQIAGADVALFFYAGHGLQVQGANWLVPVSANPVSASDLEFEMVDAESVLRQMQAARTRLNLVILDACRNNPFGGRGMRDAGGGLAQMRAPEGTIISYATQPGNVARDGDNGDSPYSQALAETMRRPGVDIFQLFNEVGLEVKRVTGGEQDPWVSHSSIDGDFFFAGAAPGDLKPALPPASVSAPAPAPVIDKEAMFWESIKDSKDPADFQEYLRQFPKGSFAGLARNRVAAVKRAEPPQEKVAAAPPPAQEKVAVATPPPAPAPAGPPASGASFRDCALCPEMVALPPGRFMMGTEPAETTREQAPERMAQLERPRHAVAVGAGLAVGKYHVTVGEFARFVQATGYRIGAGCAVLIGGKLELDNSKSWRGPGFAQTDRNPVVCVSWNDAKAYAAWLARTTGKSYRLLTEAEWEYAARGGTTTARWWGDAIGRGNADCGGCGSRWDNISTSPAGSFAPNAFGLYDMLGDAVQWTEDCANETYANAPGDASVALVSGDCGRRAVRGGSWYGIPLFVRAGIRNWFAPDYRGTNAGFRVARTQ